MLRSFYRQPITVNMKWFIQGMFALLALSNQAEALPPTPHYHTAHINPAPFRRFQSWVSTGQLEAEPKSAGIVL